MPRTWTRQMGSLPRMRPPEKKRAEKFTKTTSPLLTTPHIQICDTSTVRTYTSLTIFPPNTPRNIMGLVCCYHSVRTVYCVLVIFGTR